MRIEGKNNLGEKWYIDSDDKITVKSCNNCGNPIAILSVKQEGIKVIRFMKDDKVLAIFDLEQFRLKHVKCSFCSNVERLRK